jgi:dienelactone hydrolase
MMMKYLLALAMTVLATNIRAEIKTQSVEYKDGDVTLEGYVAYDDAKQGKLPGVLIIHQWKGLGDYEKKRAEMLAKLGYVAFAADIYGKGVRPQDVKSAGAEAGKYKSNRALLRQRANAGLAALKQQPKVDTSKVAGIGYCFGGMGVIELARSGAEMAGAVSFHGALDSPKLEDGRNIKCKVLALQGADDPFVPAKDIEAFEEEMRKNKVDWQLVKYGGAVHSFTDWGAKPGVLPGAVYNEEADHRSWKAMQSFFAEIFTAKRQ